MSWIPSQQVISLAPIIDNLFAFFEDNQENALMWASVGASVTSFQKFYTSAIGRVNTIYPSLSLIEQELKTDLDNDVLECELRLVVEGVIQGANTDEIVRNAMVYGMAVESMVANITSDELSADTNADTVAIVAPLSTKYFIGSISNAYYQVFRTTANYKITASSY